MPSDDDFDFDGPVGEWMNEMPDLRRLTGYYILDEQHVPHPAPQLEYMLWKATHAAERLVAQERSGAYWISTAFLGMDAGLGSEGSEAATYRPVLFETMAFEPDGEEVTKLRCCTWEEAERMHKEVVERFRKAEVG